MPRKKTHKGIALAKVRLLSTHKGNRAKSKNHFCSVYYLFQHKVKKERQYENEIRRIGTRARV